MTLRGLILTCILGGFTMLVYPQQIDSVGKRTRPIKLNKASLSGRITDVSTAEPLPGASVYFTNAKTGAVADEQGNYKVRNIPPGKYLIEISHLGYSTIVESVNIDGDVVVNFGLAHSIAENQGITITGVSTATLVKRAPVPVSIFRKADLLKTSAGNIIDAISKVPGVSQISSGAAISKPSIRGLGYNRVVVVNDGVRQEGQQWGDEHGIEIDEYSVNRVEVLKGPGSIMYGSDALAGVVNIMTNVPVAEGSVKGNLMANYQLNNKLRGFFANISGNNNGFNWNAYGSYKAAADYRNRYDGRVFNSKFNEKNFGGYVGLNKDWGYSHLLLSKFDQHVGMIEGDRNSSGDFLRLQNDNGVEIEIVPTRNDFHSIDPFVPKQHINHWKLTSDNSVNIGTGRVTLNIGYQKNIRQEFGNVLDPEEKELFFELQTVNYNLQYHFQQKKDWETSIGIGGMEQTNKNKGLEVLIPEYTLFDIGGFVYSKKTIGDLTISGGLRYDTRKLDSKEFDDGGILKFPAFTRNFFNLSGSAGISYEISGDVILKLNIARGFRAPSIPELGSNGAHEGTSRYEYGKQDLHSETSLQVDGGMEINTDHLSFTSNLFFNRINDFIYYRKVQAMFGGDSIIVDGTDTLTAFRFDQNDAKLFGGEIIVDIHPHPLDWLHIETSFSYVRGMLNKQEDGSHNLPFIPAPKLANELRADFKKVGKRLKNLFFKIELENTFSQNHPFTGYNTETITPGYTLLNGGFGVDISKKEKTLFSIFFAGNNITDVAYQSHLSRLKYLPQNPTTGRVGVYNMGRNFSLRVNVPISF